MNNSADLSTLLSVEPSQRDLNWEEQVLALVPQMKFKILNEVPQLGPDNWPYLMVSTEEEGSSEPALRILSWLSEKGVGLAINPQKTAPDLVLTYGMIWNFRERQKFISPIGESSAHLSSTAKVEFSSNENNVAGAPSTEYLPEYVRTILRTFLKDNGISGVKILVLSQDGTNYDLCFSLESFGSPEEKEHQGILEALSWFLPAHYSLVLISENSLPAFYDL